MMVHTLSKIWTLLYKPFSYTEMKTNKGPESPNKCQKQKQKKEYLRKGP